MQGLKWLVRPPPHSKKPFFPPSDSSNSVRRFVTPSLKKKEKNENPFVLELEKCMNINERLRKTHYETCTPLRPYSSGWLSRNGPAHCFFPLGWALIWWNRSWKKRGVCSRLPLKQSGKSKERGEVMDYVSFLCFSQKFGFGVWSR